MKKLFLFCGLFALLCNPLSMRAEENTLDAEIAAILQPYIDRGDIAGIVAVVAQKEEIKSVVSVGYQNITKGTAIDSNTLFWIASESKAITAAAVMLLVEEKKLNLDKPITLYLPELLSLASVQSITLRRLLSHTSGMKFLNSIQERAGVIDCLPLKMGVYATALTALEAQPAEKFIYSNQGIDIAAAVVEKVSGKPFEVFLQERIFEPLGMTNTTFFPTEEQLATLASSYEKAGNGALKEITVNQLQYPLSNDNCKGRYAEGGGGLFSTPNDLVKFFQMLACDGMYNNVRILQKTSVDEMTSRQTPAALSDSYGFGLFVSSTEFGHGGAYGTDGTVFRKNGWVCTYFVQQNGIAASSDALNALKSKIRALNTEVTCYPEEQATANDFWIDHFYEATCTDYTGTGSKSFGNGSGYIDFNGGSSVAFTKIRTANDATFTVTLTYGIGYADSQGAKVGLKVNGNQMDQLTLYAGEAGRTIEFDVELKGNYDNEIRFTQTKDWPLIGGIQLKKKASAVQTVKTQPYLLTADKGKIVIGNLNGTNHIQIYSVRGEMLHNTVVASNRAEFTVAPGSYIVSVNGAAAEALLLTF